MEVLFTGNLKPISDAFFYSISSEINFVVCDSSQERKWIGRQITPYNFTTGSEEFHNMFRSFQFDTTVYLSKALDGVAKAYGELESLEDTLFHCKKNKVKNFIYLASNEFVDREVIPRELMNRHILFRACEELCLSYARDGEMNISVIQVPYLYHSGYMKTQLGQLMKESIVSSEVHMPGLSEEEVDFLAEQDLAVLIARVLDEPRQGYVSMSLSGDSKVTWNQVATYLQEYNSALHVVYGHKKEGIPRYIKDSYARKEYGWFPKVDFKHSFAELYKNCLELHKEKSKKKQKKFVDSKVKEISMSMLELLVAFSIVHFTSQWITGNGMLRFLDVRLLFVVLMGTMRGLYLGILAALLASIGVAFGGLDGVQWQMAFYNIWNWLPFAVYFLVGAIAGYTKDKFQDELSFMKKEKELLENKYIFLSELYTKALKNKEAFNSQIISYTDSYGRMYDMVKRLNTTLPDQVFLEAIQITEDILNNSYVAVYTVDEKSDFARLAVCSKALTMTLAKSLKLSTYETMSSTLRNNETWVNTECILEYPAYAAPIFREGQMAGLILIMKANDEQMSMAYLNKFHIVTGLIKDSLLRAIERTELTEKDTMLPGTKILNAESFNKVLAIKKQMKKSDVSEYLLLQLQYEDKTLPELSEMIGQVVRSQDTLGVGEDGCVYLLLSQTNANYVSLIAKRLETKQISFILLEESLA